MSTTDGRGTKYDEVIDNLCPDVDQEFLPFYMPLQVDDTPIALRTYRLPNGKFPFTEWAENLRDNVFRALLYARLDRVRFGNFGDCISLSSGLYELRFHRSPGYRVYFGDLTPDMIVLLLGGIKNTQNRDVEKARNYWEDFKGRQP